MVELQDWTPDDDALLRAAMTTLRRDVEALPLTDAQLVRARGAQRRRQRMAVWTASAAAAAVVVGTVAWGQLSHDTGLPIAPATTSAGTGTTTTTTPAPSPTSGAPTLSGNALLTPPEWVALGGLTAGVQRVATGAPEMTMCGATLPGTWVEGYELGVDPAVRIGVQDRYRTRSGGGPAAAQQVVSGLLKCQTPFTVRQTAGGSSWPRVLSYYTGHTGSGWMAVAAVGDGYSVLQLHDPRVDSPPAIPGFATLAQRAQERLVRFGSSAGSTPSSTTTAPVGPTAINQTMPVSGVAPLISSSLFVAASQWASTALTGGKLTDADPGQPGGGLGGVAPCETDAYLSGVAGRYGIVRIRAGQGSAASIGLQRVRLFEDVDARSLVDADLARARSLLSHGCTLANGTVRSTAGPTAGTYRLDTVFTDGSPTVSAWVGVTAQHTQGAVSTVVITRATDPTQGFAELDRLLALARQK
jgi:hypothetical protein